MTDTLPHVSRESLLKRMQRGDPVVVVDALSPMSYAASHLPGAINLPPGWVDDRAPQAIPERDAEIVVYCQSASCDSSVLVGKRLVDLGYQNVGHYAGGKDDWVAAGLPLEGGRA
jgi:rhodanese-related sulfurtransferase